MADVDAGQQGKALSTWVIARDWARENRIIRAGLVYLTFEDRLRDARMHRAWLNAFTGYPIIVEPVARPPDRAVE